MRIGPPALTVSDPEDPHTRRYPGMGHGGGYLAQKMASRGSRRGAARAALALSAAAALLHVSAAVSVQQFSCDGGKREWPLDFAADSTTEVCDNPQGPFALREAFLLRQQLPCSLE